MLKGLYIASLSDISGGTIPSGAQNMLTNKDFDVYEIEGLGRPSAELSESELVGADASVFSKISVKNRNITLSVKTRSDTGKFNLYKLLGFGEKRRLFFENDAGIFYIDGYTKGATYTAKQARLDDFEVPFFCPYPWFRACREHRQDITFGSAFTARQAGDICAGIRIYASVDTTMELSAFDISDQRGNAIHYDTTSVYTPSRAGLALLVDTTPGAHSFLRLKDAKNVRIENDWVTVPVGEDTTITASIKNYARGVLGVAAWRDTWSGI